VGSIPTRYSNPLFFLYMTQEDIQFILDIRHLFTQWKQSGFFRTTPEQGVRLRTIYQSEMGRPMPTCSTCFVDAFYSLIIRAEALSTPTPEPTPEIEAAQIADDEQPTKRRRTRK